MEAAVLERPLEAVRIASELFLQRPDWVTFFREVFGVDGLITRLYPEVAERHRFMETDAYYELQAMLGKLRAHGGGDDGEGVETTRVITVRLPKSLHSSLLRDSKARQTSMNQLCINRLLQIADLEA
jgi:hypothetical protein